MSGLDAPITVITSARRSALWWRLKNFVSEGRQWMRLSVTTVDWKVREIVSKDFLDEGAVVMIACQ